MKRIQKLCAFTVVVLLQVLWAATGRAATPLIEVTFNETGTNVFNTGSASTHLSMLNSNSAPYDLHGAAGSGVSGASTDRAFDNTASQSLGGTAGWTTSGCSAQPMTVPAFSAASRSTVTAMKTP